MNNEIKEIYLSNLEWIKTHDNIGGVAGNLIFKDNMPYEEYEMLLKSGYFVLCNKDYITNLQQLEQDHKQTNATLMSELAKLEEEKQFVKDCGFENAQQLALDYIGIRQENERLKEEKDNLYLDNTMLKLEKDIYKQGYEDFKKLLNILQNGSDSILDKMKEIKEESDKE